MKNFVLGFLLALVMFSAAEYKIQVGYPYPKSIFQSEMSASGRILGFLFCHPDIWSLELDTSGQITLQCIEK